MRDPLLAGLRPGWSELMPLSAATALISFVIYALLWGPLIALGLMLGVCAHEAGHLFWLHRLGMHTAPPTFVPFVGAVVKVERQPESPRDELVLALAGPACGLGFAALCVSLAMLGGSWIFFWLGGLLGLMNLVDLIPAGPLDGARALSAYRRMRTSARAPTPGRQPPLQLVRPPTSKR